MKESQESFKETIDKIDYCLQGISVLEPANNKIGGVSVTSRQKSFLAALSLNHVNEPFVIRKILQAVLNGLLVPLHQQIPVSPQSPQFDYNQFVPIEEFQALKQAYDAIFEQANSEEIAILSIEELNGLQLSDEKLEEIIQIGQSYPPKEAFQIIKQFLHSDAAEQ